MVEALNESGRTYFRQFWPCWRSHSYRHQDRWLESQFSRRRLAPGANVQDATVLLFPGPIMLRIGYIVVPGFQVMVFGGLTVFELANRLTKEPYYEIRLISESGGLVQSSLGYSVMTDSFAEGGFDTVIIGGVITGAYPASSALIEYLRRGGKHPARCLNVHGSVLSGPGRRSGQSARHNPLGPRARIANDVSESQGRRRSDIYRGWSGMDIRGHDCGDRSCSLNGGKRSRFESSENCRKANGHVPSTCRRTVTALHTAGPRCKNGPDTNRAGLREKQFAHPIDGRQTR